MARYSRRYRWSHQFRRFYAKHHAGRTSYYAGVLGGLGISGGRPYNAKAHGLMHRRGRNRLGHKVVDPHKYNWRKYAKI